MLKIKKIYFFNMIEILLALSVIAIGMTSVLGLFPVGLNASREAIAQNCSADVADQMITYMRVMGESSQAAYDNTFTATATNLPNYDSGTDKLNITYSGDNATINLKSGTFDIKVKSDEFLTEYKSGIFSNFARVAPNWAIFTPIISPTNLRRRVYFIVQGPNCTESGGGNIDYSAMALVWKEPVQIKRRQANGNWGVWPENPSDTGDPKTLPLDPTLSASYTYSAKINVELSWPLELPYKDRKKRYYQVVINKP